MLSEEKSVPPEELTSPEALAKESAPPEEIALLEEVVPLGGGYATRLDLDYIVGSTIHCVWAVVGGKSYYRWVNADQIKTIVQPALAAPTVYIQYNSSNIQIQRIRPVKTF